MASASEGRNINFRTQADRASMNKGLRAYYEEGGFGGGSIYTSMPYPSSGGSHLPKLSEQISTGLSCFGMGRGGQVKGDINVAGQGDVTAGQGGQGRVAAKAGERGNTQTGIIKGFVTKKAPMSESDYGTGGSQGSEAAAASSWYRAGLENSPPPYSGSAAVGGMNLHGGSLRATAMRSGGGIQNAHLGGGD